MGHRQGYIFTNKRHSCRAIMAAILGMISNAALIAAIYLTYMNKGEAKPGYGAAGLLVAVFSVTGLLLGIVTASQKDRYKLFPCLAIVLNTIALLGIGFVVYAGMYL